MGKTIEKIALSKSHDIVLRTGSQNPLSENLSRLDKVDVAIEFTNPEVASDNLELLAGHGINTVCGSTGWLSDFDRIASIFKARETALLYASNFSIGVNLFFELNRKLAGMMNNYSSYDIRMKEIHHTEKKDAPSGTAVSLAEGIINQLDRKSSWVNSSEHKENEIPIVSVRETDVKGTHEINYRSAIDEISIRHEAYSREGFAMGALMAAEFINGKSGLFTMRDVLGI